MCSTMPVVTKDNLEMFCRLCLQPCGAPVADQRKVQFELRLMGDLLHPPNVKAARLLCMKMCAECYTRSQQLCAFREQALCTEEALRLLYEDDLKEEALCNLERFCRLCLERLAEASPLCTVAELHECIVKCSNVGVDWTDTNRSYKPKYVCALCHKKLLDIWRFYNLIKDSLHQLQEICKHIEVKDVGTQVTADMIQQSQSVVNGVTPTLKSNLKKSKKSNSPTRKKKPRKVTFQVDIREHMPIKAVKTEIGVSNKPKEDEDHKKAAPIKRVTCLKCKKSFRKQMLHDAHVRRDHEGIANPFECTHCPKSYRFLHAMQRHMEVEHATVKKPNPCAICGKNFKYKETATNHLRRVHMDERPYKCCYCDKLFGTPFLQRRHEMKHTGARPFRCTLCSKSFRDNWGLMTHMEWHTTDSALLCGICHRAQGSEEALRVHIAQKHQHKCDKCGKIYPKIYDLGVHEKKMHGKERSWKCRCCQKTFAIRASCQQHERMHLKNHLVVCAICKKGFRDHTALLTHMQKHKVKHKHEAEESKS